MVSPSSPYLRITVLVCDMKIVADEDISLVPEFFSHMGEVEQMPGRDISTRAIKDCDVLLVRSVTPVHEGFLAESGVKFVGTATTGIDHIDLDFLKKNGIGFADAAGCNSNAVVEYVLGILFLLGERHHFPLQEKTVGIIGAGRIGSRLRKKLEALDVQCFSYDPFLEEQGVSGLCSLEEVLHADIISLHPSLSTSGPYPSYHLLDQEQFQGMKQSVILVNMSRGPVIESRALLNHLKGSDMIAVLDVWEDEPDIRLELLDHTEIATPHIAGYSLEGKLKGTEMIYHKVCDFFTLPKKHQLSDFIPLPLLLGLCLGEGGSPEAMIHTAIQSCVNVCYDDWALRQTRKLDDKSRGKAFDVLRKTYPLRREFHHIKIDFEKPQLVLAKQFRALGFQV